MKIATLGPKGTCSSEVVAAYLADLGLSLGDMELCRTYEEAVHSVLAGTADHVVVAAAYMNFHQIVFRNIDKLRLHEILYSQTPSFVLASKRGLKLDSSEPRTYKVACHHAPSPLTVRLEFPTQRVDATSNARAAWMVSDGEADLCITQSKAVEAVNGEAAPEGQLEIIETYGPVDMVWAVFERGASKPGRDFWRGHFKQ